MRVKSKSNVACFILALVLITATCLTPDVNANLYYRDYTTFMDDFKELVEAHPSVATYEVIGKSVDNQDIIMFKIGNPGREKALFDGTMHGTENMGGELLYFYAEWLLTSDDVLANQILEQCYTLIVPILNIEGMQRYTRKNGNGVDLNRNFETNWNNGVSDPSSDVYRGPAPLSEPESQTLVEVFQTYNPKFYVNLHMWAGPYYAGSTYANRTYCRWLVDEIESLSAERGVSPFSYSGELSGAGMAISDAANAGITSFLIELGDRILSTEGVRTTLLNRFIPTAAVLSQECEATADGHEDHYWPTADLNKDGEVNLFDSIIVTAAYGSKPDSVNWDDRADINSDGTVNVFDYVVIATSYGDNYPTLMMPFDSDLSPIVEDHSGYRNDGLATGVTWTSEGALGGGYSFDGNDFVVIPDDSSLDGNGRWNELSIEFWIKPTSLLHGARIIAKKASSDSTGSYIVGFQTSTIYAANTLFFGVTVDGEWEEIVCSDEPLQVGSGYHIVCNYKSREGLSIIVNGNLKITRLLEGYIDSGSVDEPLFIGYDGISRYFVGVLDEVNISPTTSYDEPVAPNSMRIGISYGSNGQHYLDTTDSMLDEDFSLFKANNIDLISVGVIWKAVEPQTRGVYDSSVIANLKRVLAKAEEYGIKVLFSFHTHFQQQADPYATPWHLPTYVVDPYTGKRITLAIVRSDNMKSAFLDYVGYVVSQVKDSAAIEAWSLLNEPMYWWDSGLPSGFDHKQRFLELMAEGKALIRISDPRPVTAKFALPHSPWSGDFDLDGVMRVMDSIVSLNVYIDPITGVDQWGMTLDDLERTISNCKAYGKELWITEFGKGTLVDSVQNDYFGAILSIFRDMDIRTAVAWTWTHDQTGMSDYDRGWSICYDDGEPRPAFQKLVDYAIE